MSVIYNARDYIAKHKYCKFILSHVLFECNQEGMHESHFSCTKSIKEISTIKHFLCLIFFLKHLGRRHLNYVDLGDQNGGISISWAGSS